MTRKQLKRRIRECEAEIETIKTLPYYTIFNRQQEQEEDLKALHEELERLLSFRAKCNEVDESNISEISPAVEMTESAYQQTTNQHIDQFLNFSIFQSFK